jgi:hypothetical protein
VSPLPTSVEPTEVANPKREKRLRQLARMRGRAELLRWRTVPRVRKPGPRRDINLWLPLTPFLILLSPLLLLAAGIAVFLPRPFGLNPAMVVLGVGRVLVALSGTQVDIDRASTNVHINIL